jgi:hypothetical protein
MGDLLSRKDAKAQRKDNDLDHLQKRWNKK